MALSGSRIRAARESAGLTRTELAVEVGRSEQTIILYETGRHPAPTEIVVRIAEVLGIHPGELFDDDQESVHA